MMQQFVFSHSSYSHPWATFSRKLQLRIDTPYCLGSFDVKEAESRQMFLAQGFQGSLIDGNRVDFYWLVDKEDGVVCDARFQAFGDSALIGSAEVACELVIGKNYDQARRITADLIDKHVRDKNDMPSFPDSAHYLLNLVIDAIDMAAESCTGIPLASTYVAPPTMGHNIEVLEGGYPGFDTLSHDQKLALIESVLATEVRPYIELDGGGVKVHQYEEGEGQKHLHIAYSGACTSCHSSTGATLSYIQQILKARVHPDIEVIPHL